MNLKRIDTIHVNVAAKKISLRISFALQLRQFSGQLFDGFASAFKIQTSLLLLFLESDTQLFELIDLFVHSLKFVRVLD